MWLLVLEIYLVVGFLHNFTAMVVRKILAPPEPPPPTSWVYVVQALMFIVGWLLWPFALAANIQDFYRWRKTKK